MIAELKIYADYTSEEPTKVYTLRRTSTKVIKRFADFRVQYEKLAKSNELDDMDKYDECMKELDDLFKFVFPDITDDELDNADLSDKMDFVSALVNHFNYIAAKN